jgi:hypothetical protein
MNGCAEDVVREIDDPVTRAIVQIGCRAFVVGCSSSVAE